MTVARRFSVAILLAISAIFVSADVSSFAGQLAGPGGCCPFVAQQDK
jgi:hypothetical protein